jgi:hypothetical protein
MGMEKAIDAAAGPDRRGVLRLGAALGAAGLLARALPAAAAPALPMPQAIGRGLYLVDGWLLTEADLARLGLR